MTAELDIIIPVYNEGKNIVPVLEALRRSVKTLFRVLICYDLNDDDTLQALKTHSVQDIPILLVKNNSRGVLNAILAGFAASTAPAVLMYPADDDYNPPRIDGMVEKFHQGYDIVAASRFIKGGCMEGCPWLKAFLIRASAFVLYHFARLPVHDPSNGLRLFSRRTITKIPIESTMGFAYSIELLVKAHRRGWKIAEVPFEWHERKQGESRFQVIRWLPQYLKWFRYAFATTFLGRKVTT